jgi:phosphoesterase RecJ-like protein
MLNSEQQIFNQIEKSSSILVIFPEANGSRSDSEDALASSLAIYLFLKSLGKNVDIISANQDIAKRPLSFLPGYQDIASSLKNLRRFIVSVNIGQAKIHNIRYTLDAGKINFIISPATGWFSPEDVSSRAGEFKYDLIITIGTRDLESLGKIYDDNIEFFYKTTIINLDYQAANEEFGQINFIDLNALSSAEVVYYILKNSHPEHITEDIATCLLAGIMQQTKNFKTTNLTPRTLLTTSELIDKGAHREDIIDHLYRSHDLPSLKLWGKILNNLQTSKNGALLWSALKKTDLQIEGIDLSRLSDLIDDLVGSVPEVKLVAIISEVTNNQSLVQLYSLKNIDAQATLKNYHPTGNRREAQAVISLNLEETTINLVNELGAYLDKLTS